MMNTENAPGHGLNGRLTSISWALFLIMLGGLLMVPSGTVPESTWLLGVGIILLGLNTVRYLNKIRMSGLTIILGVVALIAGIAGFFGAEVAIFPILLVIIGVSIMVEALNKKGCGCCCSDK